MAWDRGWVLAALLVAGFTPAHAGSPAFEISGFGGYRAGGDLDASEAADGTATDIGFENSATWGLGFGLYRDAGSFYEFLYSRQTTDSDEPVQPAGLLDVSTQYYHIGGTLIFDTRPWLRPYVSLTVGLTRFSAGGFDTENDFSGSLGAGLRMPLGARVTVILGLRGYMTILDSNSSFFCASGDGEAACLIRTSGDAFFQGEATAGIALRF